MAERLEVLTRADWRPKYPTLKPQNGCSNWKQRLREVHRE